LEIVLILPAAAIVFGPAPEVTGAEGDRHGTRPGALVLGLKPAIVLSGLSVAGFLCFVPMAMPQGHLVAVCSDVGIPISQGDATRSVLLGCAFVSRQFWGYVADRIGGLRTILAGSACQITAIIGFLLTQSEA